MLRTGSNLWSGNPLDLEANAVPMEPTRHKSEAFNTICTASGYLTQMSAYVELVMFKTQNTSCKTVQTHTLGRTRTWPSGADFQHKLWGPKEELQTTAQFIKSIHLQI